MSKELHIGKRSLCGYKNHWFFLKAHGRTVEDAISLARNESYESLTNLRTLMQQFDMEADDFKSQFANFKAESDEMLTIIEELLQCEPSEKINMF